MRKLCKGLIALALAGTFLFGSVPWAGINDSVFQFTDLFKMHAKAETSDIYTYSISDGKATITDCDDEADGAISVPSLLGGFPVTGIGNSAFSGCMALTSVILPSGLESIGNEAFMNCFTLSNITLPVGLTSIGYSAFYNCRALAEIVIPDQITSIADGLFTECSGLEEVTLPGGLTSIGDGAFSGCAALNTLSIPDNVENIGQEAFAGCAGLNEVEFGNGLKNIGDSAFYGCSSLTSINLPVGLASIGSWAFKDNKLLANISIPASTSIGLEAFDNTAWLNSKPNGLVYIEKTVYKYKGTMPANTNIELKADTIAIVDNVFTGFTGLARITIPAGVRNIGRRAFDSCTNLVNVRLTNGVTTIGAEAFCNCSSLMGIALPYTVTAIGEKAMGYIRTQQIYTIKSNFVIFCSASSAAQKYARDNGFQYYTPPTLSETRASSASYNSIKLSWKPAAGVKDGYIVYRYNTAKKTYDRIKVTSATSYIDTGRVTGQEYSYKVRSFKTVNGTNLYGLPSVAFKGKAIPSAPTNFGAVRYTSTSVKLSWSAVAGATGYVVYRYSPSAGQYIRIKVLSQRSFINTGLQKNATYYYKVRAYKTVNDINVYGNVTSAVKVKTY